MGYHHSHLPDYKTLVEQFERLGLNRFIKLYSKSEGIIGESDSVKFLQQKQKLWHLITSTVGGQKEDQTNH